MDALRPFPRLLLVLTICATFAVALIGCSASQDTNTANSNTTPTTGNTNKTTTANTAASPAASPAAPSGDKIGVAECDDYIAKYEACVNSKVPEAQRAAMKTAFEQAREGYRKAAATPQGKATLAQACKTAEATAKQSMAAYGCTF
jgi:hypothetical protein